MNLTKLFILNIVLILSCQLHAQYFFNINDFEASKKSLSLNGNAKIINQHLVITDANQNEVGSCWYAVQKMDINIGFDTHFTFKITNGPGQDGEGIAFVMQNTSNKIVGKAGKTIGYCSIPGGLALEFDTKNDEEGSKNHIAILLYDRLKREYYSVATVHSIPEINDGKEHFTKIEYHGGRLSVFLDSYLFPVLSLKIDLQEYFSRSEGKVWMGFTSSTSSAIAKHELIEWHANILAEKPKDIKTEKIEINYSDTIFVSNRKVKISVWDNNKVDGDVVSIQLNDNWVLSNYTLAKEPFELDVSLTGFENKLILYAQDLGTNPPNTATFMVDDGVEKKIIVLNADFKKSEAILIKIKPN